jgi:hypothetical protein
MAFSAEAKWGSVSKRVGAFIAGRPEFGSRLLERDPEKCEAVFREIARQINNLKRDRAYKPIPL